VLQINQGAQEALSEGVVMSKRKVVWGVSQGSYSDYQVVCICDSKERAERIAEASGGGFERVFAEEFSLVEEDPVVVTFHRMEVRIHGDGFASEVEYSSRESSVIPGVIGDVRRWSWYWSARKAGGVLVVEGTDRESVRKIFGERRALLIADPSERKRIHGSARSKD